MLTEHGVGVREAAAVLGVGGAGQVAGRLFYRRIAGVTWSWARTWVVLAVVALTTVGLAEIHRPLVVVGALSFPGRGGPRDCSRSSRRPQSRSGGARSATALATASCPGPRWAPLRSRPGSGPSSRWSSVGTARRSGASRPSPSSGRSSSGRQVAPPPRRWLEPVADARLGDEVPRSRRIGLELLAQGAEVGTQVVGLAAVRRSPDLVQQVALADQATVGAHQHVEQGPLVGGQVDVVAAPGSPGGGRGR